MIPHFNHVSERERENCLILIHLLPLYLTHMCIHINSYLMTKLTSPPPPQTLSHIHMCVHVVCVCVCVYLSSTLHPMFPVVIILVFLNPCRYMVSVGLLDKLRDHFTTITGPIDDLAVTKLILGGLNLLVATTAFMHTRLGMGRYVLARLLQ